MYLVHFTYFNDRILLTSLHNADLFANAASTKEAVALCDFVLLISFSEMLHHLTF